MATAANPFDINSGTNKTGGLLTSAMSNIAAPTTTGYDAATAGATGYDSTGANSFGYDANNMSASTYDASKGNTAQWGVADNQTVQGQLKSILDSNSPLLQQSQTNALQTMNQRGLLNSSMAIGAGQDAVIKNALQIATPDAATYANAAKSNQDATNSMTQFNVGQDNTALQYNANALNSAASQNQNAENNAAQFSAAASNQAALANQAAANQAAQFTAGAANQAALANQAAQNQAAQFTAGSENTASEQFAQSLNATVNKMMDQSMQIALSNADQQTKIDLQNIDAQTRKDLAATEAAYKNQMQASSSANDMFQQVSKNISDIMANPDLETAAKQAAVDSQKSYLQNALAVLSATSGVTGLKNLLTFP